MRISPINNTLYSTKTLTNHADKRQTDTLPKPAENSVSFKSLESWLTYLALRKGINGVRGHIQKEKLGSFKEALTVNVIDKTNVMETICALAKLEAETFPIAVDISNIPTKFLELNQHYDIPFRIIKDAALKGLFPLIPDLPNDSNGGHAAKFELLLNMVKTGDYLTSSYFYEILKNLPQTYNNEKTTLVQEMLTSINLKRTIDDTLVEGEVDVRWSASSIFNRPDKDYLRRQARERVNRLSDVVNYAMITTLDYNKNQTFFYMNNDIIQKIRDSAYKIVLSEITERKSKFYTLYSGGFRDDNFTVPEQVISRELFFYGMNKFRYDKAGGMEYFNVDRELFEDMLKDYNACLLAGKVSNPESAKMIIEKRVAEKQKSTNGYIANSANGFLRVIGHAKDKEPAVDNGSLAKLIEANKSIRDTIQYNLESTEIRATYEMFY